MASIDDVWVALRACLISQFATFPIPLVDTLGNPTIYIDTTPAQQAGMLVKGALGVPVMISIFDLGRVPDKSFYHPRYSGNFVKNPTSINVAISSWILPPGQSVTVTLSGTPALNDAVGFQTILGGQWRGQTAYNNPLTTLAEIASALAVNINADPVLGPMVSAAVVGPVVTVTNNSGLALQVSATRGNVGYRTREWGRKCHSVLIKSYCQTQETRKLVIPIIDATISQLQARANLLTTQFTQMPDGTWLHVDRKYDQVRRDFHSVDIFSYDAVADCDFSITTKESLWSVEVIQNNIVAGV
jgi:hypothetical protein